MFILGITLAAIIATCWWTMIRMPGRSFRGPLPPLSVRDRAVSESLRREVLKLAGEIGRRSVHQPEALQAAADFIETSLREVGLAVSRQTFTAQNQTCVNLEAGVRGASRATEIVVLGAHYDTVIWAPGADDNASGVAALLALSRNFAPTRPARTLRFLAFVKVTRQKSWTTTAAGDLIL
jgi:acetylornithine deacetylase/succinyl-diaminopimelate desuccinylase-like protein